MTEKKEVQLFTDGACSGNRPVSLVLVLLSDSCLLEH